VIGIDLAADVTQDALVRVWRELPGLRDPGRFPAWARRIVVNRCRDIIRAERRRPNVVSSTDVERAPAEGSPGPAIEGTTDLTAAIARLPFEQRQILALHYALDLTIHDAAETLGIPDGTMKSRLSAALATLRRELGEGDG
jgi:RNA polymerase sigma-70 factor (ECF subfamily)